MSGLYTEASYENSIIELFRDNLGYNESVIKYQTRI